MPGTVRTATVDGRGPTRRNQPRCRFAGVGVAELSFVSKNTAPMSVRIFEHWRRRASLLSGRRGRRGQIPLVSVDERNRAGLPQTRDDGQYFVVVKGSVATDSGSIEHGAPAAVSQARAELLVPQGDLARWPRRSPHMRQRRWRRSGRYLADRVMTPAGKALKTLLLSSVQN